MESVTRLLDTYNKLTVPRDHVVAFSHYLQARDTWFVEAGDVGLYYLTHIVPRLSAQFHMVFWDQRLSADRRESAKSVLRTAFKLFDLRRIGASTVSTNMPMRKTLKRLDFQPEGITRNAVVVDGHVYDLYNFGLLREEATWPVLTTSLG